MNIQERILTWDCKHIPQQHGFGSAVYADDWVLPERTISDHEIFFMVEGEMNFWLDQRKWHLRPGDVLLFMPNQRQYGEVVPTGGRTWSYHVHFSPEAEPHWIDAQPLREELAHLNHIAPQREDVRFEANPIAQGIYILESFTLTEERNAIYRLFESAVMDQIAVRYGAQRMGDFILGELLLHLTRITLRYLMPTNTPGFNTHPIFQRALYLMQQHLAEPIEIGELAAQLQVSPQHLMRVFHNVTGKTPLQYLNHLRLIRARDLIRYTDMSMKEIARQVGFRHAHYFTRLFHRHEGITPSAYRDAIPRHISTLGDRIQTPRPKDIAEGINATLLPKKPRV